jgi:hypothetical protein
LVIILPELRHQTKLVLGVEVVEESAEASVTVFSVVKDLADGSLQPQITAVAVDARIVSKLLCMPAEIELIVGLVPVPQGHYQLRFIVAFKTGARNYVENAIGSVAVISRIAAALDLEIIDVLWVNLRSQIARDVCVRDRHSVNQPAHLMAAANVELIVSEIGSRDVVGNHLQAIGAIRAGRQGDVLPVNESYRSHGINVYRLLLSFRRDGSGLAHGGNLKLEVENRRGVRTQCDRRALACKSALRYGHHVIAERHGRKRKGAVWLRLRGLGPGRRGRFQRHFDTANRPVLRVMNDAANVSENRCSH